MENHRSVEWARIYALLPRPLSLTIFIVPIPTLRARFTDASRFHIHFQTSPSKFVLLSYLTLSSLAIAEKFTTKKSVVKSPTF